MPELRIGTLTLAANQGDLLLDTLLAAGQPISWSCRSGHCQSCLIQARPEQIPAAAQAGLDSTRSQAGWLLACQCRVKGDMQLSLHDPATDGLGARVDSVHLLPGDILLLALRPERPLRFHPGQHVSLWLDTQLARPYSIANLPGEQLLLFHLRLHPQGAFSQRAKQLQPGDRLFIGPASGALHYDPQWQERPLLLLARGTGLAPLQAIVAAALQHQHQGRIDLWHWSGKGLGCYQEKPLKMLAEQHPELHLHLHDETELAADLTQLRLASRTTMALVCGHPAFVEQVRRPLFMAGLPRHHVLDEAFISRTG